MRGAWHWQGRNKNAILCQCRAGTVYGAGLRRCLIIFAPQTLILDRRTRTCRTPSLQLVLRRSKNFTSGAAIPFAPRSVPSSPFDAPDHLTSSKAPQGPITHSPVIPQRRAVTGHSSARRDTERSKRTQGEGEKKDHAPHCPEWAPRPSTTPDLATLGRCSDIPWTGIQPSAGRFEHTEFSTVSIDGGLWWWTGGVC